MSNREKYMPGPAAGAEVQKDGEKWMLILARELRHPPAMVWQALTDPAHLSEWAPFDALFAAKATEDDHVVRARIAHGLQERGHVGDVVVVESWSCS